MKSYKELIEGLVFEGHDRYPGDDMTQKELKIAINAAKNILEMLDDGAELMRWQISAIVKASDELASVCTSMKADEEDDEEEDDEPMYVGFEYPRMYDEEVELDEAVVKQGSKEHLDKLKGMLDKVKPGSVDHSQIRGAISAMFGDQHIPAKHKNITAVNEVIKGWKHAARDIAKWRATKGKNVILVSLKKDGTERKTSSSISHYNTEDDALEYHKRIVRLNPKMKIGHNMYVDGKLTKTLDGTINEELDYKVSVDGLPDMYVKANSPAEVKASLRKVIKKPDAIQSVDRVTQAMLKKIFRDKAMGKEDMDEEVEVDESSFVAKAAHAKVAGDSSFRLKGDEKEYPVTIKAHHARKIKRNIEE